MNALGDWFARVAPWAYWQLSPPAPDEDVSAELHALVAVQTVLANAVVEAALYRRGELPSGRRRWGERSVTAMLTFVLWAWIAGAWDRRAASRRRRRWRRPFGFLG